MENAIKAKAIYSTIAYYHHPNTKEACYKLEEGIKSGLDRLTGMETREERAGIILHEINDVYPIYTTNRPVIMCEIMNALDKVRDEAAHG